jgi:hypothetical protein
MDDDNRGISFFYLFFGSFFSLFFLRGKRKKEGREGKEGYPHTQKAPSGSVSLQIFSDAFILSVHTIVID